MPNWTQNELEVIGKPKDIAAFKKKMRRKVKGKEAIALTFEAILPIPKVFDRISNGGMTIQGRDRVKHWIEEHKGEKTFTSRPAFVHPVSPTESKYLEEKYGSSDWYSWCCKNWGVKWDASEVRLECPIPTHLLYRFESPWGPPDMWYEKLVKMFPKLEFKLTYRNEDDGYEVENCL